jgi:hypothetical protein
MQPGSIIEFPADNFKLCTCFGCRSEFSCRSYGKFFGDWFCNQYDNGYDRAAFNKHHESDRADSDGAFNGHYGHYGDAFGGDHERAPVVRHSAFAAVNRITGGYDEHHAGSSGQSRAGKLPPGKSWNDLQRGCRNNGKSIENRTKTSNN